jgi:2-polyprenyl-3-methyl-5-hydroxy-6-metoxy-1,4-benzoquinol methylase
MHNKNTLEDSKTSNRGRTTNEEATLEKEFYFNDGYFSYEQFMSFAEQLRLVYSLNEKSILEIGIGNGIVSDFLKKAGFNVTTFDINPNLSPDIVGNVTELIDIFQEPKYDLILCAEVLEHMPFEYFEKAIVNIAHTTKKYAILTLPRSQRILVDIQFSFKLPKIQRIYNGLTVSFPNSIIPSLHHWELDSSKETRIKAINSIIKKYFTIIDSNRFRFRSYHHYFILKKYDCGIINPVDRERSFNL